MALIRQFEGRPAVVETANRGRVYINVHDAEYLRKRAEWRKKLADQHPDRSPAHHSKSSGARFRVLKRQYESWLISEKQWYEQYNLKPPEHGSRARRYGASEISEASDVEHTVDHVADALNTTEAAVTPTPRWTPERLEMLASDGATRVLMVLNDRKKHTWQEIADAVGGTIKSAHRGVTHLRHLGYVIEMARGHGEQQSLLLVSAGRPKKKSAQKIVAALLADGQRHSSQEIRQATGGQGPPTIARLRSRGFDIQTTSVKQGETYYQLMQEPSMDKTTNETTERAPERTETVTERTVTKTEPVAEPPTVTQVETTDRDGKPVTVEHA